MDLVYISESEIRFGLGGVVAGLTLEKRYFGVPTELSRGETWTEFLNYSHGQATGQYEICKRKPRVEHRSLSLRDSILFVGKWPPFYDVNLALYCSRLIHVLL